MWDVMQELDTKFKIGCVFTESKLEIRHPNGAKLKLMGADAKEYRKKLKGKKFPGVAIDEAQDFTSDQLIALVDDSLTPSIADYKDGWLALTGTPGPVPQGYFFEATYKGKFGYSLHKWTLLENPHMPDPAGFIDDLIKRREWTHDHPSLLREYRNQWVLDTQSLWVRYNEEINDFNTLPRNHQWNYLLGVDIGFKDADALAVVAWSETCPDTYLVEEIVTSKQDITSLAEQIKFIQDKYKISKTVMDEGGLGKKAAEEIRRRHGLAIVPADKVRKQENVELLNDAMRRGRFKASKNSKFASDSYLIQIDWDKSSPNKIVIKKGYHSDIIDAVLYAFKESYSYTHTPEEPKIPYGSKRWYLKQEEDMFERALESAQAETSEFPDQKWEKWLKDGE